MSDVLLDEVETLVLLEVAVQGPPGANEAAPLRRELAYAAGRLSEVRLYQDGATLSEVRQFAYDMSNRLSAVTYRDGAMDLVRTRTLGYDLSGLLVAVIDS